MFKLIRIFFPISVGHGDETAKKLLFNHLIKNYPKTRIELVLATDNFLNQKIHDLFAVEIVDRIVNIVSLKDLAANPEKYEEADLCLNISANTLTDLPTRFDQNGNPVYSIITANGQSDNIPRSIDSIKKGGLSNLIVTNWPKIMKSKAYGVLSPFNQGEKMTDPYLLIQLKGQKKTHFIPLDLENSTFFHPISTIETAISELEKIDHPKKNLIPLLRQKQKNEIETQLIYSLSPQFHGVMMRLDAIVSTAVKAAQLYRNKNQKIKKPLVLLLANDFSSADIQRILNAIKGHADFHTIEDPKLINILSQTDPKKIIVLHIGSMPQSAFLAFGYTSSLPPYAEGENFELSLKNAGKPSVHLEQGCGILKNKPMPKSLYDVPSNQMRTVVSKIATTCEAGTQPEKFLAEYYKMLADQNSAYSQYFKAEIEKHHRKANRLEFFVNSVQKMIDEKPLISKNDSYALQQTIRETELEKFKDLIQYNNPFHSPDFNELSAVAYALMNKKYDFVIAAMLQYPNEDTDLPIEWLQQFDGIFQFMVSRANPDLSQSMSGFFNLVRPALDLIYAKKAKEFKSRSSYNPIDLQLNPHPLVVATLFHLKDHAHSLKKWFPIEKLSAFDQEALIKIAITQSNASMLQHCLANGIQFTASHVKLACQFSNKSTFLNLLAYSKNNQKLKELAPIWFFNQLNSLKLKESELLSLSLKNTDSSIFLFMMSSLSYQNLAETHSERQKIMERLSENFDEGNFQCRPFDIHSSMVGFCSVPPLISPTILENVRHAMQWTATLSVFAAHMTPALPNPNLNESQYINSSESLMVTPDVSMADTPMWLLIALTIGSILFVGLLLKVVMSCCEDTKEPARNFNH